MHELRRIFDATLGDVGVVGPEGIPFVTTRQEAPPAPPMLNLAVLWVRTIPRVLTIALLARPVPCHCIVRTPPTFIHPLP